jgi:hypothetical protein
MANASLSQITIGFCKPNDRPTQTKTAMLTMALSLVATVLWLHPKLLAKSMEWPKRYVSVPLGIGRSY